MRWRHGRNGSAARQFASSGRVFVPRAPRDNPRRSATAPRACSRPRRNRQWSWAHAAFPQEVTLRAALADGWVGGGTLQSAGPDCCGARRWLWRALIAASRRAVMRYGRKLAGGMSDTPLPRSLRATRAIAAGFRLARRGGSLSRRSRRASATASVATRTSNLARLHDPPAAERLYIAREGINTEWIGENGRVLSVMPDLPANVPAAWRADGTRASATAGAGRRGRVPPPLSRTRRRGLAAAVPVAAGADAPPRCQRSPMLRRALGPRALER